MNPSRIILIIILFFVVLIVIIPLGLRLMGVDILSISNTSVPKASEGINVMSRSDDNGKTWKDVSVSEDPRVSFPATIFKVISHPRNQDIFFLGTKASGLWKTVNGGRTWNRMNDSGKTLMPTADVYDVEITGSDAEIIYAAVFQNKHGRILKSENSGANFHEVYSTTAEGAAVFDVVVDVHDSNHIMIATGENGLFESKNGGATWGVKKWFTEPPIKILVNPRNTSELYVMVAGGGILKSVDGGTQWGDLSENTGSTETVVSTYSLGWGDIFGSQTTAIAQKVFLLDPNNPSYLYIGSAQGFLKSEDGGLTFKKLKLLLPQEGLSIRAIGIDPRNSQIIFAAAQNELHTSMDGGTTWSVQRFSTSKNIVNLVIPQATSQIMFIMFNK